MGIEAQEAHMASNGKGLDVRGEVVDLLLEKIASDRNPSVTMMNMVEELLTPDDVPAYVGILLDKVKTGGRYPSYSMLRRILALISYQERECRQVRGWRSRSLGS
jgi:hypothetical protein